jgi:hypothetical protein
MIIIRFRLGFESTYTRIIAKKPFHLKKNGAPMLGVQRFTYKNLTGT